MKADILIRGAEIYDGEGGPPRTGAIAVARDCIRAVGPEAAGADAHRVIDARGLAAAPGFVAIHKMTWAPCRRLGLADRGRLRAGCKADVALFDPATVRDAATFEDPIRYPAGVETVLVNGTVAVEAGQHTGARAGRILRRPRRP